MIDPRAGILCFLNVLETLEASVSVRKRRVLFKFSINYYSTNFLSWQVCTDPTSKTPYLCRLGAVAVDISFLFFYGITFA